MFISLGVITFRGDKVFSSSSLNYFNRYLSPRWLKYESSRIYLKLSENYIFLHLFNVLEQRDFPLRHVDESAAMLVSQTNHVKGELFSSVNTFFCFNYKFAWLLTT